jgi:hypothetical protein
MMRKNTVSLFFLFLMLPSIFLLESAHGAPVSVELGINSNATESSLLSTEELALVGEESDPTAVEKGAINKLAGSAKSIIVAVGGNKVFKTDETFNHWFSIILGDGNRSPAENFTLLNGIAASDKAVVVVGGAGPYAGQAFLDISTNGWKRIPFPALFATLNAIAYNKKTGRWIAVGDDGLILEAKGAIPGEWTRSILPVAQQHIDFLAIASNSEALDEEQWLAVGRYATVLTRTKGEDTVAKWSYLSNLASENISKSDFLGVASQGGKAWQVVGSQGEIWTASEPNGQWTKNVYSLTKGYREPLWAVGCKPNSHDCVAVGKYTTAIATLDKHILSEVRNPKTQLDSRRAENQAYWGILWATDQWIAVGTQGMINTLKIEDGQPVWTPRLKPQPGGTNFRSVMIFPPL